MGIERLLLPIFLSTVKEIVDVKVIALVLSIAVLVVVFVSISTSIQ